jgi:hypothetical protein
MLGKRRSLATARIALWGRLSAIFPHRIAAHLDAVRVVDQPVKDAVGQRGIADLFGRQVTGRQVTTTGDDDR